MISSVSLSCTESDGGQHGPDKVETDHIGAGKTLGLNVFVCQKRLSLLFSRVRQLHAPENAGVQVNDHARDQEESNQLPEKRWMLCRRDLDLVDGVSSHKASILKNPDWIKDLDLEDCRPHVDDDEVMKLVEELEEAHDASQPHKAEDFHQAYGLGISLLAVGDASEAVPVCPVVDEGERDAGDGVKPEAQGGG